MIEGLMNHDPYMLFADFAAYARCHEDVGWAYLDTPRWSKMSILNVARIGMFSSDRAIREYCDEIWRVRPVTV